MKKRPKSGQNRIPKVERSARSGKLTSAERHEKNPANVREDDGHYISGIAATLGEFEKVQNDFTHWLGLSHTVVKNLMTDFDLIKLGNTGITKTSIYTLADRIGITRKYISEKIFDISVKTLERKEDKEKLDKKISSHALEIAKLLQHAYTVFREEEKVKRWFNRDNRALNNMKPVELLDTLSGLVLVDDLLGRIEEGVYS